MKEKKKKKTDGIRFFWGLYKFLRVQHKSACDVGIAFFPSVTFTLFNYLLFTILTA